MYMHNDKLKVILVYTISVCVWGCGVGWVFPVGFQIVSLLVEGLYR